MCVPAARVKCFFSQNPYTDTYMGVENSMNMRYHQHLGEGRGVVGENFCKLTENSILWKNYSTHCQLVIMNVQPTFITWYPWLPCTLGNIGCHVQLGSNPSRISVFPWIYFSFSQQNINIHEHLLLYNFKPQRLLVFQEPARYNLHQGHIRTGN